MRGISVSFALGQGRRLCYFGAKPSLFTSVLVPIECLILPEHRLVWLRYWGNLTRPEIFESFEGFRNVPNYDISFDVLQDFRGTESNDLTHSDVILLAESINNRRQSLGFSVRIAVLAPGDLGFGMGRMFVTLLGESKFITASAFRELNEAAAFLGLSGEACETIRSATPEQHLSHQPAKR